MCIRDSAEGEGGERGGGHFAWRPMSDSPGTRARCLLPDTDDAVWRSLQRIFRQWRKAKHARATNVLAGYHSHVARHINDENTHNFSTACQSSHDLDLHSESCFTHHDAVFHF
eukprot:2790167-Rhodomonas_salina.1